MREQRIYLAPPNVGEEEKRVAAQAIDGGWVAPAGPELDQFEMQLEELYGRRVLGLNSGTSALHLALILAGVEADDEVLVGTFTFAACASTVKYQKAQPVFIDSEVDSWNTDPSLLSEYLTSNRRKPKALIVTHLYGVPAKIQEIRSICDEHDIILIEDAAEALGSLHREKPVGTFGHLGIVSFNGNKIITTGGGGVLIGNDNEYDRARYLATQANSGQFGYNHDEVGYNYRMSNVAASIGLSQLARLNDFVEKKRKIFDRYKSGLPEEIFEFPEEHPDNFCNRWLTTALIRDEALKRVDPVQLLRHLDEHNMEGRLLWKPLHLHKAYAECSFVGSGVAEGFFNRGLCLPSGTGLTDTEQDEIIAAIRNFIG